MPNTTKPALQPIETTKLTAVTGGCAACGNPGLKHQQQPRPNAQGQSQG